MVFCDINHFLLCRFFGKLDCLVWLVYPVVTVRHNCYNSRHCRQIFSVWQEITHPFSNTLFQFRYNIHCSTQILNVCVMNLYVFIHYTKWQQLDQDTECFQHTRVMQSSARSLQYLMYPKRGDSFLFPKCDKPRLDSRKKLGGMRAGRIP